MRNAPLKKQKIVNRKRRVEEERPQQVEVVPAVDDIRSIIREVMAANPVVTPVIAPQAPPTVAERLSILNAEIELAKIRHRNPMLRANMNDDEDNDSEN